MRLTRNGLGGSNPLVSAQKNGCALKYKVAIVGAGPAGYFAAQALQNLENESHQFAVDMFERLPTPWGLVRSGVAPDHPKIKTVAKTFEKIASHPHFRLIANIELGTDIHLDELKENYDLVVLATGTNQGRKLGITGEDLPGSLSAAEFVPWYNAHPDYINVEVPLSGETAVVIGAGNVAMDVGRILALEPSELDTTDTSKIALEKLHASNIRTVHIFGRRGPEHVAFTSPELRELPKLEHTDVIMALDEINEAIERVQDNAEKSVISNLEAMRQIASTPKKGSSRQLVFHFLATPKEIRGEDGVEEIVFTKNRIVEGRIEPTGEEITIQTGLVITAIGYNAEISHDLTYESGRIKNIDGHVTENLYVVGWAKRGPSGVIGTNKSDAADVIGRATQRLREAKSTGDFLDSLKDRGLTFVSQQQWEKINAAEVSQGEPLGKPREKFLYRDEMLSLK
jgi:ferredoxin/flavodoxin---NADP+ reductase